MFKSFENINNFVFKSLLVIFLLVSFSLFFISRVEAASLSLSPNSSNTSMGNIISVKIIVNTDNKYINNADAIIQFPTDLLEVVSLSKNPSIFSLWVEEPSFSNYTGRITFNGGVSNPGFNGSNGTIATITFKAKKQGTASLIFLDSAVRENNGLGTDILTAKDSGIIQIGAVKEIEIPEITDDKDVTLSRPIISSDTHPDQDLWYSNDTANFSWKIPSGTISLKTLFNKISDSVPTISYDNSVTQKTLNNLSDGISYFHLRYFNSIGGSPIAHYKIKVDTTPPSKFTPTIRFDNNQGIIKLNAQDATSGIDYYAILIDGGSLQKVKKEKLVNNEYNLPVQVEGDHNLVVKAYDKAGNYTESSLVFTSPIISIPVLSLNTNEITSGDSVVILGKTDYPNRQVEVTLESDGKEIKKYTQTISADGNFSITTDKIKKTGSIGIWAETVFSETIKSRPSEKVYLKVNETEALKITLEIFYRLLGLIVIIILLLIILFTLYLGWHKYLGLKKKVENESKQTVTEIHKAMLLLKEELNDQLEILERTKKDRDLNKREEEIFKEIKDNINGLDEFIEKKLKKIL